MRKLIKLFFGKIIEDTVDAKLQAERMGSVPMDSYSEMNDIYLFDFKAGYRDGNYHTPQIMIDGDTESNGTEEKTIKVKVKPIDVVDQLERKPKAIDLELIDEKIALLKDKVSIIRQEYAKREVEAMLERLEARKLYTEHHRYFERFDCTDDKKIAAFLKKYDLVMEKSDIFIPDFPEEAIKIMKDYEGQVKFITDKKPVFYVIAEKEDFNYAYDKRDPILLAQSPFGFYWQILGAWDEELQYLGDL